MITIPSSNDEILGDEEAGVVPLGSLCEIFDGPHATPKKTESGPIFLGISNLSAGRLDLSDVEHLSEEDFTRWTRRITPRGGDIVFSYETRLGEAAMIPGGLRTCLGRRMGLLRVDPNKADPRFLLYAYLSPEFQDTIRARTVPGSTVDRIPLVDLPNFPIRVPALETQRAIAHILGTLDDKIELNRRMNRTLEELARALFKSWFVDFDPVRAKAEGRQPAGMDAATAALFPCAFEVSELGEIPRGWRVATIDEIVDVIYGAPFSSGSFNSDGKGFPLLRIRDLATHDPGLCTTEDLPRSTKVRPGDVVVGMDGEFRAHTWTGPVSVLNQRVCLFTPRNHASRTFVRLAIEQPLAFFEGAKTGTTVIHLGKGDIDTIRVVDPGPQVLDAFGVLAEPLTNKVLANAAQSRTLAALRDALLPKLLSGEVRVQDCEDVA